MLEYFWKAQNTLYARETPESEVKIKGWVWNKGDPALQFTKIREHGDRVWGSVERGTGDDVMVGWFKLRVTHNSQFFYNCNATLTQISRSWHEIHVNFQ